MATSWTGKIWKSSIFLLILCKSIRAWWLPCCIFRRSCSGFRKSCSASGGALLIAEMN